MPRIELQSKLTLFDVTNLVVGAIIGADIYRGVIIRAGYLGPFSLVVWVIAGIIALVIALCFAQCAALLSRVGGPYAYAKEAWGPFVGFIVAGRFGLLNGFPWLSFLWRSLGIWLFPSI
jgi:amino acid transporter